MSVKLSIPKVLAILLLAAVVVIGVCSVIVQRRIINIGRIRAVGCQVYADPGASLVLTEISWGVLEPNQTATHNIYIKNTGNTNVFFTFNTSEWDPLNASTYLTQTWSYAGETVQPEQIAAVELRLSVSPDVSGVTNFTFYTNVYAQGLE